MFQNYYEILGVSEDSSVEQIKEIYKKLCLIYHPDKNRSKAALEKFRQIQTAYEVLTDDISRLAYDRERTCEPIEIKVPLTMGEMMHGCSKSIAVSRMVLKNFGVEKDSKVFVLDVKPGIKAGTKYTFTGEGHRLPGKKLGDVIFKIEEINHPIFVRDGNNIRCRRIVSTKSLSQGINIVLPNSALSVLGFYMAFPLHSKDLENTKEKRFPGLGFPNSKEPEKRGDLIIEFVIDSNTEMNDQYNCNWNETTSNQPRFGY